MKARRDGTSPRENPCTTPNSPFSGYRAFEACCKELSVQGTESGCLEMPARHDRQIPWKAAAKSTRAHLVRDDSLRDRSRAGLLAPGSFSGRTFPQASACSGFSSLRPRLQRRDRSGFAPHSLFSGPHDKRAPAPTSTQKVSASIQIVNDRRHESGRFGHPSRWQLAGDREDDLEHRRDSASALHATRDELRHIFLPAFPETKTETG